MLRRNVELNHLTNVETIQKAAGETNRTIMFYEGLWPSTWTAVMDSKLAKEDGRTIQVEGVKLDGLLSSYGSIDLVKIDVEGYEIQVLNGMKEILPKVNKIIIETDEKTQDTIRQILQNFDVSVLDPGNISDNLMFTKRA